tara:strand:+ start:131 stop:307 length:177 start_codon:yes stop_codon:yes gene_type:complete
VLVGQEQIQTYQIIEELQEMLQQLLGVLQQFLEVEEALMKLLDFLVALVVEREEGVME